MCVKAECFAHGLIGIHSVFRKNKQNLDCNLLENILIEKYADEGENDPIRQCHPNSSLYKV